MEGSDENMGELQVWTGTYLSNMANVILRSLYFLFVLFEMIRSNMLKKKKKATTSLCRIFIATIKLMNLTLSSVSVLHLQV